MSSPPLKRLPFAPLVEALGPVYLPAPLMNQSTDRARDFPGHVDWRRVKGNPCTILAELAGVSVRRMQRWSMVGIPEEEADRVAIAIGLHPALIWPEWFEQETA